MVQLSDPHMTTGKTIALTRLPLLAIFLLLNMLSMLVLTFLPRSKSHFISLIQIFVFTSFFENTEDKMSVSGIFVTTGACGAFSGSRPFSV